MVGDIKFYGQQGEDMIAWELFKTSPAGFFIDVGANDGITFSNTFFFEKQGWTGLCFEPDPIAFEELKTNRKCVSINCIVGECVCEGASFSVNGASTLSKRSLNPDELKLPLITLNYALRLFDINHVDYVSVDVEGWEEQVLLGFDILKYKPRLAVVEDNGSRGVADYFESNGYVMGRKHYFNVFYLRDRTDIDVIASINPNMENGRVMS